MKRFTVCAVLGFCLSTAVQAADLSIYLCPKVSAPPVIDGRLDDAAWQSGPLVALVDAVTGKAARNKTSARMCWDDSNLYVSFRCDDTDIWGTFTKRDQKVYLEEVVEVFAAPQRNLKRYFEVNVSPLNVVFDSIVYDPVDGRLGSGTSGAWNIEGVRTAVVVDGTLDNRADRDNGWTAEFAIPFAGLETHTPKPGERWRLNLYRIDLNPQPAEFLAWSPTYHVPAAFHIPERFGTVFFTNCAR